MPVDYNNISKNFSDSRKNMKWEEIDYFLDFIDKNNKKNPEILDIGCGSGRLLETLESKNIIKISDQYLGIDSSSGMIDEAMKKNPDYNFQVIDMTKLEKLGDSKKYDCIFFIASFHHLENEEQRLAVLQKATTLLKDGGHIFMTNWSLKSESNKEKYKNNEVGETENVHGGSDFSIKFGEYSRYYHCFTISELDYILSSNQLKIIENREFENKKNFISIVQK